MCRAVGGGWTWHIPDLTAGEIGKIFFFLIGLIGFGALMLLLKKGPMGLQLFFVQIFDMSAKIMRNLKFAKPQYFAIPHDVGMAYITRLKLGMALALESGDTAIYKALRAQHAAFLRGIGPWSLRNAPKTRDASVRLMNTLISDIEGGKFQLSPEAERALLDPLLMGGVAAGGYGLVRLVGLLLRFFKPTLPELPD